MLYDALMATNKPRITVTISPATYELLKELSELNEESMSSTVGGLLEQVAPVLERMNRILKAANAAKESVKGRLADDFEQAQGRMEKALGLVMDDFASLELPFLTLEKDIREGVWRGADARDMTASDAERGRWHGLREASGRMLFEGGKTGDFLGGATPISNRGVRSRRGTSKKAIFSTAYDEVGGCEVEGVQPPANPLKKSARKVAGSRSKKGG